MFSLMGMGGRGSCCSGMECGLVFAVGDEDLLGTFLKERGRENDLREVQPTRLFTFVSSSSCSFVPASFFSNTTPQVLLHIEPSKREQNALPRLLPTTLEVQPFLPFQAARTAQRSNTPALLNGLTASLSLRLSSGSSQVPISNTSDEIEGKRSWQGITD